MAVGRVNVGGGAGAATLNIYTQMSEPKKKNGIWIQTLDKFQNITMDTDVWEAGDWINNYLTPSPVAKAGHMSILVGRKIYIIGGVVNSYSTTGNNIYSLDLTTNVWSFESDIPWLNSNSSTTGHLRAYARNGNIYMSGRVGSSGVYHRIYNIESKTWTTSTTTAPGGGTSTNYCFPYGDDVSINVGFNGDNVNITKYNISTGVWTTIYSGSYSNVASCSVEMIGDYIYAVAGLASYGGFKVELSTGVRTNIARSPAVTSATPSLASGSNIELFGTSIGYGTQHQIYNTTTDTWSQVGDLPMGVISTTPVADEVDKKIHLIGGYSQANGTNAALKTALTKSFNAKIYPNKELVIKILNQPNASPNQYKVRLFDTKIKIKNEQIYAYFLDAWIYRDNDLNYAPSYWGDGTQWVQFK